MGQEHLDDVRALVGIGQARTWEAFRDALRDWAVPVFNFVCAGAGGQIGYQCAGRVPLRGRVRRGFREGGHPQDAWQGYVPFDALPRLEQPARGYVASANNRAVQDGYPYPLYGAWAPGTARAPGAGPAQRATLHPRGDDRPPERRLQRPRAASPPPSGAGCGRRARATRTWPSSNPPWGLGPPLHPAEHHPDSVRDLQPGLAAPRRAERFPQRLLPLVQGQGSVAARLLEGDDPGWFPGPQALASALTETAGKP